MRIINLPIDEITPYEGNPRKNDNAIHAVAESIRNFGFKVPIVIDKNNIIIAGHTRLKAAKLLNLEMVPVIKAEDLTEEQVQAFRLADNKTGELAGWDFIKLQEELDGITGIDMYGLGFENDKDFNVDDFFKDEAEEKKQPKMIKCPHCNEWMEVE